MLVLIGLGGNLGDVQRTFALALTRLAEAVTVRAVSGLWRSAPIGPDQPEYLNAAVLVDSAMPPIELLAHCHLLEARAGRDRATETKWGPRPLDLDLLLAENLISAGPALVLPHPRLDSRRFALLPACELQPAWVHPRRLQSIKELLETLDPTEQPCHRVAAPGTW